MIEKQLDTLSKRQVFKRVSVYLLNRIWKSCKHRANTFKNNWFHKPIGSLAVLKHSVKDKFYSFLYEKGWKKKPVESIEKEFDKKTKICFEKQLLPSLYKLFDERTQGNADIYATLDGKPVFSALGAYLYKDNINREEFSLSYYPYSKAFAGGRAVASTWAAGLTKKFDTEFEKIFLNSMDIDQEFTKNPSSHAYYSRGLVNMAPWFTTIMLDNPEANFFIRRFLFSYMRLVHLEQKRLDVDTGYINNLRKEWEQELVHDFTLGVTLIGISRYALIYTSLPTSVKKRVPNYRSRQSYEKQGVYRRPTELFESSKRDYYG